MSIQLYPVDNVQFLLHDGPDYISQRLRQGKSWEPLLLDIIKLLLRGVEHPVFVDIGANLGAISVPIGKFMQQRHLEGKGLGQVHSIEAQRNVFYQLCGNFFVNDLGRYCFAYHAAVSNQPGEIKIPFLSLSHENNVGALSLDESIRKEQGWQSEFEYYENVAVTTIDQLNLPSAHVVKIDVEGMELEVISGGLEWLQRSGFPPILLEVWDESMQQQLPKRESLLKLLEEQGYEYLIHGELCIAQHHKNRCLEFVLNENNQLSKINLLR